MCGTRSADMPSLAAVMLRRFFATDGSPPDMMGGFPRRHDRLLQPTGA